MASLGSLVVSLALDTARFQGDLGKAAHAAERRMKSIKTSVVNSLSGIAAAFSIAGIVSFVREAAAAADEMLTLAERTGRTVESLSQLDYVARRGNTSLETLIKSQDQLAKKMGATDEEGKAAVKVLDELGLSADRIRSLAPDQQIEAIADAMGRVKNPTDRARIAMTLFGKSGTELLPVLKDGAGGIRELREEADRLGITMTDLEARRLAKIDDQLEASSGQFRKLKTEIAGILALPVGSFFELLQKGLVGWRVMLGLSGDEIEDLNTKMVELVAEQDRLREAERQGANKEFTQPRLAAIREEIALIQERLEYLYREPLLLARIAEDEARLAEATRKSKDEFAGLTEVVVTATKMMDPLAHMYSSTATEIEKATVAYRDFRAELERELELGNINTDTFNKRLDEFISKTIPDVKVTARKIEENKKQIDSLSTYAEQAARNIQSHFADFLFDPFDKGIKGMLQGFIDVLRRMVAEAAAAKILEGLSGQLGTALGGLFGGGGGGSLFGTSTGGKLKLPPGTVPTVPGFASGGYMSPGSVGIVGERGPELAIAGRRGASIIPFSNRHGGRVININHTYAPNIHVEAQTDRTSMLAALERSSRETYRASIATMTELIRGGAFA